MNELLTKILTDASVRTPEAIEASAAQDNTFDAWLN